jgi:hypothetical protein
VSLPEAAPVPAPLTDADRLAAAVQSCPGVARLAGGGLVPVATYLPGRRVDGVRLTEGRVLVAVVARYPVPLPQIAGEIRAAVAGVVTGRPVDVHFADIDVSAHPASGQPTLLDRSLPPGSS